MPHAFVRMSEYQANRKTHPKGTDMRRLAGPLIAVAVAGLVAGAAYRYFWNDPDEATIANYLRSGLHGAVIAVFGWGPISTSTCAPADG